MDLDFSKIRALDGSQPSGFEELCCQLARREADVPSGCTFYRLRGAGGDAGVECYWVLPDGSKWGWQSKYLFDLKEAQWRQIDKSVETALKVHPQLTRYVLCFPVNLTPPTTRPGKSQVEKWDEHAAKWQQLAQAKGIDIRFERWDKSEIIDLLTQPHLAGKIYFWFNRDELTDEWLMARFDAAKENVGPRYTPEVNVDLPIARVFEGLGRTCAFFDDLKRRYSRLCREWNDLRPWLPRLRRRKAIRDIAPRLEARVSPLLAAARTAISLRSDVGGDSFAPLGMTDLLVSCDRAVDAAHECWGALSSLAEETKHPRRRPPTNRAVRADDFSTASHYAYELFSAAQDFGEQLESDQLCLADRPGLVVIGVAGAGKTHLLCDVAERRLGAGLATILFLGTHFTLGRNPWMQMTDELGLKCESIEEWLGALQALAEAKGARVLLMVDAVNEGDGRDVWRDYLPGMLNNLEQYPGVALALTCRTSYEKSLIPKHLNVVRVVDEGFEGHEVEAVRTFFTHYGIDLPSAPLMVPEARSPLFLKLLCSSLQRGGHKRIPVGLVGARQIFEFVVDTVNEKLTSEFMPAFSVTDRIVQRALNALADAMAEAGTEWLTRERAVAAMSSALGEVGFDHPLLAPLTNEGVLAEDRRPLADDPEEWVDVVTFAYQRFGQQLIAGRLMARHRGEADPATLFTEGAPLHFLVADERAARRYSGLIEALWLHLAEEDQMELVEVAPWAKSWEPICVAFLNGLPWRKPDSVKEATIGYLNELLRGRLSFEVLSTLLTLATRPNHPLNAEHLHPFLKQMPMPARDAWWSYFVHEQHRAEGSVERLLNWVESEAGETWSDESARLCAIVLTWFLATPNRFVRDRATKALVALLRKRVAILRDLLSLFADVNDIYVLERLYCAAYGCAMTTPSVQGLKELAEETYSRIFSDSCPPAHILLRDYARGVIETAMHRGCHPDVSDENMIRPPYVSEWPLAVPSEDDLKALDTDDYGAIRSSLEIGWGDFARYVIGTDHAKLRSFDFDTVAAQRWVLKRVLELGWTPERFARIDENIQFRNQRTRLRDNHKPERFGKKYQWIALHELLARVADNCAWRRKYDDDDPEYRGPWQFWRRDIDPSFVPRQPPSGVHRSAAKADPPWWAPVSHDFSRAAHQEPLEWLGQDDFPDVRQLIALKCPETGLDWLAIQGYYSWHARIPPEDDRRTAPRREIWCHIRSYLVRRRHSAGLYRWLQEAGLRERWEWMPEPFHLPDVFLGEYPWHQSCERYPREWMNADDHDDNIPVPVIPTAEKYYWERGYDCSIEETVNGILPSPFIVEKARLTWARRGFDYSDADGRLVATCPAVEREGPQALLMSKDFILRFLEAERLDLIWVTIGEKLFIPPRSEDYPGRLDVEGVFRLRHGELQGGPLRCVFNPAPGTSTRR